jgi:hypothetical protein
MNFLAAVSDSTQSNLFRLFFGAAIVYLAVHLVFRRLSGGVLPAVRAATAFALATAFYCVGLTFVLPSAPLVVSFDRPDSIADVQDPQTLLRLLQAQNTALVQMITIQERTAFLLYLATMSAGFSGLAFLWRMRAAHRESEYFRRQGHNIPDKETHTV